MRLGAFRKLGHVSYGGGRIVLVDYQLGNQKSIYLGPTLENIHFAELDEPEVGNISAKNFGDGPVFIPSGWLIGGLKQSRMVLQDAIVDVGETVMISVVCCEQKRWGQSESVSSFNRAPATVLAQSRIPARDFRQRQQRVWASVSNIENRTSVRETNSLEQIMNEEIRSNSRFHGMSKEIYDFAISNQANGYFFENEGSLQAFEIFESVDLFAESGLGDIVGLLLDVSENVSKQKSSDDFENIISRIDLRNSRILETDDLYQLVEVHIDGFSTQALLNPQDQLVHLSGVKLPQMQ
jgi:hypothetical protein